MSERLTFQDETLIYQKRVLTVDFSKRMWGFVTTTAGLATWLPELSIGYPGPEGVYLLKDPAGHTVERSVLAYDQEHLSLTLQWDEGGTIQFSFQPHGQLGEIDFEGQFPATTTHLAYEIANWSIAVERLRAQIEQSGFLFDEARFSPVERRYDNLISDAKQSKGEPTC
ncbi:hypothetical protein [Levilactobacillus bambusae]|uniref:ATPase n=1 Tax=Levilactobacillus bambusae TaxID=2024736 RepID=A0A2V1MZZ3_9LACO|nr:hypothetical protein [Levilactobacillus bambusae]PWF99695.1 hypothetical protein DCM90_07725 [Levilactobacillus bambusae]